MSSVEVGEVGIRAVRVVKVKAKRCMQICTIQFFDMVRMEARVTVLIGG